MDIENLLPEHREDHEARDAAAKEIQNDGNPKKVVVAGPGIRKTHLFKQLLLFKDDANFLTLSFINALGTRIVR